ncbi:MAG: hypothetical protein DHS20C18_19000 [Saprospiraceae bacterium]|nr:MAG: hypothetical protein DHS20C18_19000 [Saprospiraceae bacterium]
MKYRRLHLNELQELEQDFVKYLATNTIPGSDWEKMKKEKPEQAEAHIEVFSDLIFERTLQAVEYLELKTPKDIRTFYCEKDKISMLGLLVEGETPLDLTRNESPEQMMQIVKRSGAKLKMYRAERTYREEREMELFKLLEQGALISKDGGMYKLLAGMKKQE